MNQNSSPLHETRSFDALRGRDLDAMVAQHVFGLEVEPRDDAGSLKRDAVQRLPNGEWVRVAFYSASIGASLNVQLALLDRGWTWAEPPERGTGDVRVVGAGSRRTGR